MWAHSLLVALLHGNDPLVLKPNRIVVHSCKVSILSLFSISLSPNNDWKLLSSHSQSFFLFYYFGFFYMSHFSPQEKNEGGWERERVLGNIKILGLSWVFALNCLLGVFLSRISDWKGILKIGKSETNPPAADAQTLTRSRSFNSSRTLKERFLSLSTKVGVSDSVNICEIPSILW
jgi:hypothetical protein